MPSTSKSHRSVFIGELRYFCAWPAIVLFACLAPGRGNWLRLGAAQLICCRLRPTPRSWRQGPGVGQRWGQEEDTGQRQQGEMVEFGVGAEIGAVPRLSACIGYSLPGWDRLWVAPGVQVRGRWSSTYDFKVQSGAWGSAGWPDRERPRQRWGVRHGLRHCRAKSDGPGWSVC